MLGNFTPSLDDCECFTDYIGLAIFWLVIILAAIIYPFYTLFQRVVNLVKMA